MFCKKCGKRIPDNAAVCENCGTEILTDEIGNITDCIEEQTAEKQEKEAQKTVYAEKSDQVSEESPAEEKTQTSLKDEQNSDTAVTEEKVRSEIKPKNRKKPALIIGGVVALILCVAIIIVSFPYIKNAFAKLFMSPEDYFAYVVKNNSEETAKTLTNTLDSLKKTTVNGASATGTASVEIEAPFHDVLADVTSDVKIGGTIGSVLGKFMDISVGSLTEWVDEVSVDYEVKSDGKNSQAIFDLDVNDAEFGKIDVATDKKNGVTYIGVPDYCDGYFIAEQNENSNLVKQEAEDILTALPEKELTEELIMNYIECFAENVGDVKETSKTIYAGKFAKKVVALTAEIDNDEMGKITDKLLDKIDNDKDLAEIIEEVAKTSGKSKDDVKKSLHNLFREFKKFYAEELKGNMTLILYVDAKGTIIGTEINSVNFEYSNCTITKWFEIGNSIRGKAGIVSFELVGNGKLEKNKVKLDYKLDIAGTHVADVHIFDLDYKKMKDGLYDTKINVAFNENVSKVGSMFIKDDNKDSAITKLIKIIPEITLNIDLLQKSQDETVINAKINYQNKLALNADISNKNGERKTVKIPDKYIDIKVIGVIKALGTADLGKFVDFLGEAEFPQAGLLKLGYKLIFR